MEIEVSDTLPDEREESVRMIAESAEGVLRGDRERARALRFSKPGYDSGKFGAFAELGWLMVQLPESRGGLGLGNSELCAIARALGRELTPEPVVAACLAACCAPEDVLEAILACETIVLPAFAAFEKAAPELTGGTIRGSCDPVPFGHSADFLLVQTVSGAALVRADADGVSFNTRETHDGGNLAFIEFHNAPAVSVEADMGELREEATLAHCAYLLGLAESAFDITTDYLKDRKQFDKPIGSFQALQHRAVDLLLDLSLTRAAIEDAAGKLDDGASGDHAALAVSLAKARASGASQRITQAAIQLHGGIGYTDEADIGLYLRKCMTLSGLLGSQEFHLRRAFALQEKLP